MGKLYHECSEAKNELTVNGRDDLLFIELTDILIYILMFVSHVIDMYSEDYVENSSGIKPATRDELAKLEKTEKPTFWVDRESVQDMGLKTGEQYQKFKAKNIKLHGVTGDEGFGRLLVNINIFCLKYFFSIGIIACRIADNITQK
jgi:hypothetical protein